MGIPYPLMVHTNSGPYDTPQIHHTGHAVLKFMMPGVGHSLVVKAFDSDTEGPGFNPS